MEGARGGSRQPRRVVRRLVRAAGERPPPRRPPPVSPRRGADLLFVPPAARADRPRPAGAADVLLLEAVRLAPRFLVAMLSPPLPVVSGATRDRRRRPARPASTCTRHTIGSTSRPAPGASGPARGARGAAGAHERRSAARTACFNGLAANTGAGARVAAAGVARPPMRRLPALAHRDFRLFWSGQLISLIGTWMQSVGQAWLVLELTGSAFKLGVIGTLQFAPVLCFAFVGGALSDRVPKRRLLLATQTTLMLQALVLGALAWTGHVRYWHVAVLATVYGFANALDMPARQSYVAELVDRAHLMNAIALNSAAFNGARVVGPAAAGVVVARWGAAAAFLVNGVSFVAVLAALLTIRVEGVPRPRQEATILQELVEALRYVAATPRVRLVLGLLSSVSLFVINYNVLVPLIARELLHGGAHEFGLLMAAHGTGALTGALVLALLGLARPPLPAVVVPALVVSAATATLGLFRVLPLTAAVLVVVGLAQILFMTGCNTSIQVIVPDELRGRLMGLYALVFVGVAPIGSFLMGSLAETLGVGAACAIGGGLGLGLVLTLTVLSRPGQARASLA